MNNIQEIPADRPELLSKREVAALLGVSTLWIWRYVKSGWFPAPLRLGGKLGCSLRWRRAEVEEFIANAPRQDNRGTDTALRPGPKAKRGTGNKKDDADA